MSTNEPLGVEHYRSLFEGSQASLADMAARQAQALARVGRLRSAIVAVLRKNFMELSAQAEANLGGRLSEIDDEILLAYLDAFTAAASRGDQRATVQALKEAVIALGVPLRGDEPLVWVEQIHQHRQKTSPSPAPVTKADDATTNKERDDGAGRREHRAEPASSRPLPVDDYWKWDDATPLSDLFDDVDGPGIVDEPRRWDSDLGSLAPDEEKWTPSPIAPGRTPSSRGASPAPAVAPEPEETIRVQPVAQPAERTIAPVDETSVGEPSDSAGNATDAVRQSAQTGRPKKTAKREPRRRATAPRAADETPASRETPSHDDIDLSSLFDGADGDAADVDASFVDPAFDGGGTTPRQTSADTAHLVAPPMRPELFAPTSPRKKRTARTKATPAENLTLTEAAPALELNDGMRRALLAAAAIPRPVFTRDLIGVAGSLAMVDAWEAECRADISNSPVRFVAPKSRHRLRGHLVAVEPAEVRPTDWWYQAVQRYRAGRLYELGVLLHRVGDEIVSFDLEEQIATFRLNTPRGLIGMVVLLDPRPAAGSSDVGNHLERLLAERLTMVAVLTASAEPGSLENLTSHLEQLARERNWQPTAPVIAARSWEYADDRGTSAVMVLGQG